MGAMKQQTVGMIGLGIMGSAMSANLMRAGFRVTGFDVVPRRRAEHARAGGVAARSPREVARRTEIVITSLPSAYALAEVAAELGASAKRGTIVIETSTLPIPVKEAARNVLREARRDPARLPLERHGRPGARQGPAHLRKRRSRRVPRDHPGAAGLYQRELLRRTLRQRIKSEICRQPARRHPQRRGGGGDGAGNESRARSRADSQGRCRRPPAARACSRCADR